MKRASKRFAKNVLGKRITLPDVRPLDERLKSLKVKKCNHTNIFHQGSTTICRKCKQILFSYANEFPDLDTDLASLLPDYVRKRKKYGYKVTIEPGQSGHTNDLTGPECYLVGDIA
jgi:hypothetical protein